jgi:hypothetical protein
LFALSWKLRAPELLEENMNSKIKMALVAGLALGGLGFVAETASAMPMRGLDPAAAQTNEVQQGTQNVRYICGYYGCRWVPGPYYRYRYRYYHPYWRHRYYHPYWRHRYYRWHRW